MLRHKVAKAKCAIQLFEPLLLQVGQVLVRAEVRASIAPRTDVRRSGELRHLLSDFVQQQARKQSR